MCCRFTYISLLAFLSCFHLAEPAFAARSDDSKYKSAYFQCVIRVAPRQAAQFVLAPPDDMVANFAPLQSGLLGCARTLHVILGSDWTVYRIRGHLAAAFANNLKRLPVDRLPMASPGSTTDFEVADAIGACVLDARFADSSSLFFPSLQPDQEAAIAQRLRTTVEMCMARIPGQLQVDFGMVRAAIGVAILRSRLGSAGDVAAR